LPEPPMRCGSAPRRADASGAQDYLALGQFLIGDNKGKRLDSLTRTHQPSAPSGNGSNPVTVRAAAEFFARGNGGGGAVNGQPAAPTVIPTATRSPAPIGPSVGASTMIETLESAIGVAEPKAASLTAEDVRTRLLELTTRVSRLADKARTESAVQQITPLTLIPTSTEPSRAAAAEPAVSGLLGVKITSSGVLFVQPLSLGKQVSIAGDFNGWSPMSLPMTRNERLGVYERLVQIPPGRWQYRLVIDGHWTHDAVNPNSQNNPFGGLNSILDIPATSGNRL
ncbi:MAG: glycogen-binding domain-containing protein, partial [Phycisphaerales bacterium]|nr:glycogen-binding domain-containing protein [Phycisphaerales bacterium]